MAESNRLLECGNNNNNNNNNMSVLASVTTLSVSAYPDYFPQYSHTPFCEYYPALPIIRTVEEVDLGINSTTHAIIDEYDFVEDIQLKSFAKSATKVKIKVNKVEKLSIIV